MIVMRSLLPGKRGSTAAEFALVLPLLLIMLFGIIDAGRLMWTMNQGQKAAQVGARVAVATDVIPSGLLEYTFVSDTNPPGSSVSGMFGSITCQGSGETPKCECTANPCSAAMVGTPNSTAFGLILARIQNFYPEVANSNLKIIYEGVGLGYAGNPYGSDVSPMVTLEISGAPFRPITLLLFGAPEFALPPFRSSMTLEDGVGSVSN